MDYSNLTPEQTRQLAAMGGNTEQMGELQNQLRYTQGLRQGAPQGQMTGRVYTAANPLEHLGALGMNYAVGKKSKELQAQISDLSGKNTDARQSYMLQLLRGGQQQPVLGQDPRMMGNGPV